MTLQNAQRTRLDVIASVALVGLLSFMSYKWLRSSGPLKFAGGLLLAILIADILSTSNYWISFLNTAFQKENQWAAQMEGLKNVQGLA